MNPIDHWIKEFERVESEEHPSDKHRAMVEFIESIQRDAAQVTAEAILLRISAHGIDVTDCDGDDDPATVVGDWAAGRIEAHAYEADRLRNRLDQLTDSF